MLENRIFQRLVTPSVIREGRQPDRSPLFSIFVNKRRSVVKKNTIRSMTCSDESVEVKIKIVDGITDLPLCIFGQTRSLKQVSFRHMPLLV